MGEAGRRRAYEAECLRKMYEERDRELERKRDAVFFRGFVTGFAFALAAAAVAVLAYLR